MIPDRRVISGELHYPRIPRAYWGDRLRMARAMGLDTISTYVFWNRHEPEPGAYDFSGENDVAAFIRDAHAQGLDVILRPGPYVCAEWDFGGLPAWLLRDRVPIRTSHELYMRPVRAWLRRLGRELAPLQRAHGGPIIAVQLENEYGAFGSDRAYLRALRDALVDAGFGESPLFTIDQPSDLAAGSLDELPIAATFAPGNPAREFEGVRALRSQAPLLCGEYWAGWFDHWGEEHHRLDPQQQALDLRWMLREGCSVNIYMFHGGTNFGFWNGANSSQSHPYEPTTTSYDYDAALDEAGRPTPKYFLFREAIASETGAVPPDVPAAPRTIAVPEFTLEESCPLLGADLGRAMESDLPQPMEVLGQSLGYVLYRTLLDDPVEGELVIDSVRDYAVVSIDGRVAAHLDRRLGESRAVIRTAAARATLDILVENCGRINYGPDLPFEHKGITRAVLLNDRQVRGWQIFALPFAPPDVRAFKHACANGPAFYRGTMHLEDPADTFLDVSRLGKGAVWVNGRNAGRFWSIGPQYALYVPGVWLHAGNNEVTVLDLFPHERAPRLRGVQEPIMK
ncbi:MAG TPA: glycoside hydrolase family 35 protein [Candidatus Baltobacteraceae bacterium]|nr:glycoside hydrolase family 35 protein [Candidatus Baltobacteraceae bacterium]